VPEPLIVTATLSGPEGKKMLFAPGTNGKVQSGGPGQEELVLFFPGEQASAALDPGFNTVNLKFRLGHSEFELSGELGRP
jgi:hypothetical protein